MSFLHKLLSTKTKNSIRRSVNIALPMAASSDSAAVHAPASLRKSKRLYHLHGADLKSPAGADGLPIPPATLRMGYSVDDDNFYLESGRETVEILKRIMDESGYTLTDTAKILELGCATCRVLRHFKAEADCREVWGCDQHEESILWDKANMSPPFNFLTVMRLPHLPFEDNKFGMIYGISVFTHIEFLVDTWLMELRRIMEPGGCLMLTIHDEASIAELKKRPHPAWLEPDIALDELTVKDCTIAPWGAPDTAPRHDAALPFYKSDYIKSEWGKYFSSCEVYPCALDAQTLVVLRK